jgi:hypothetical protein
MQNGRNKKKKSFGHAPLSSYTSLSLECNRLLRTGEMKGEGRSEGKREK